MPEKIIAQGAEALLIKKGGLLLKRRIKKGYRHPSLDWNLRTTRTRREARILQKALSIISIPKVRAIDGMVKQKLEPETEIEMEFVDGKLLSEHLDKLKKAKALKTCKEIGRQTAALHDTGIIHGDLTTSNMILKKEKRKYKVYFIDFGLAFHSARVEDKAVDLHLLKEALKSRHFKHWKAYFKAVLDGYSASENALKVAERLKKVEARGRYKGKGKRQHGKSKKSRN